MQRVIHNYPNLKKSFNLHLYLLKLCKKFPYLDLALGTNRLFKFFAKIILKKVYQELQVLVGRIVMCK
jgi:hypothetical protein